MNQSYDLLMMPYIR